MLRVQLRRARGRGRRLLGGATWFIKNANATTGAGAPIIIPPDNEDVIDYEGELAVVIGRDCHRVPASEALGYVAGYTLVNDVSARLLTARTGAPTTSGGP